MSVVTDASVLVAALTDSERTGHWAVEILSEDHPVAPDLALVEASNILRRLERSRILSPEEALAAHQDLLQLDLILVPIEPFAARIWELRRNISAYDAWYVAVAESFGIALATLDRRLTRAAGPTCPFRAPS
jgi:predicted nucleic acid-binding protein